MVNDKIDKNHGRDDTGVIWINEDAIKKGEPAAAERFGVTNGKY